jgi:RimJ/RimL family protein N-acetyltransferase
VLVDGPHAAVAIGFVDDVRYADGSAADALRVICSGLPRAMPVQRIEALVDAGASSSVEAHRKAGFEREGVLREALLEGNAYRDGVIMSVLVDG